MALFFVSSLSFGQGNNDGTGGTGSPNPPTEDPFPCNLGEINNTSLFKESVGVNYLFSDPAGPVDGIATKFRLFSLWHNTGWGDNYDQYFNQWGPDEFHPDWSYNFDNYVNSAPEPNNPDGDSGESLIGVKLQNLYRDGKIDALFPTISTSIGYLATNYIWIPEHYEWNSNTNMDELFSGHWESIDNNHRDAIWRKPIPFQVNTSAPDTQVDKVKYNPIVGCPIGQEDECDEAYKFYSEYLTHIAGFFGENSTPPYPNNYSNYLNDYFTGELTPNSYVNTHIELWNEPDAWWTKPNDFGYFTPKELAVMCRAALNSPGLTTQINGTSVPVGLLNRIDQSKYKIISPSLHEMDLDYFQTFMTELNKPTSLPNFEFDVVGFHHYSAYEIDRLKTIKTLLGHNPTPSELTDKSTSRINKTTHPFALSDGDISTVELEAAPSSNSAYWICPESDGYYERGNKVRSQIPNPELWWTEWGYSSVDGGENGNVQTAKYPSSLSRGFTSPEETQARWMLRGFLEIDKSEFTASMWHWYKEENGGSWDTHTGLLDAYGQKKTAWYYLHTIMNEIGELFFLGDQVITRPNPNNNEEEIPCDVGYVPNLLIDFPNTNDLSGENPNFSCPKIFWYSELENEDGGPPHFTDLVTVVWFPYMVNYASEIEIPIDAIQCNFPTHYYIVTPVDGEPNGVVGKILPILWENAPANTEGPYIKIPASEKPIFIHYLDDDNGGTTPVSTCSYVVSSNCVPDCTSITFPLTFASQQNGCTPLSSIEAITVTSGSANVPLPIHIASTNLNPISPQFVITGLQPCTDYSFDIAINYTDPNNFTGIIITTVSCTTTCEKPDGSDCISSDITFGNPTTTFSCWEPMATVCLPIIFDNLTAEDLSSFTLNASYGQGTAGGGSNGSSFLPTGSFSPGDWEFNATGAEVCFSIENIALDAYYNITFQLVDNSGNVWVESTATIKTPAVINDGEGKPCSGPGGPTDPIVSVSADCKEHTVCFTPVYDSEGKLITEYKLIVRDQSGTTLEFFVDFKDQDLEDGKYCFEGIDLGPLKNEPIVGFIKTISSQGNSNSSNFDLEKCCNGEYDLNIYDSCKNGSVDVVIEFCYDPRNACFNTSIDQFTFTSIPSHPFTTWKECWPPFNYGYSPATQCCLYFFTRFDEDDCIDIDFEITKQLSDGTEFNIGGKLERSDCCDGAQNPENPLAIEYDRISTSGEKISISAKTPFILQQMIVESRLNNIPVEYVLYNKQQDQFEKVKHYNDRMFFDLPEDDIDINLINAKYEILLLVNNDIVHMNFPALDPELPPTQERKKFEASGIKQSMLSVLPNPAQNEILISLESGNITQLKLYNSLGELEIEKKVDIDHLSIDISILSSGVYFIDVLTSDNKHIQQKLIIQQ